jgi:hypothetical protein
MTTTTKHIADLLKRKSEEALPEDRTLIDLIKERHTLKCNRDGLMLEREELCPPEEEYDEEYERAEQRIRVLEDYVIAEIGKVDEKIDAILKQSEIH